MIFTSGTTRVPITTLLCLMALCLTIVAGDNSVHILKASPYSQLITSSTLRWLPQSHARAEGENDFVIGGFKFVPRSEDDPSATDNNRVDSKPIFVCRALLNGIHVSGGQVEGDKRCVVSLLGNVHSYERYDLLENVDKAARLTWVPWNKYVQPPEGGIATDETYVARHKVPNDEVDPSAQTMDGFTGHYIGKYDPKDKLGSITYVKDGVEVSVDSGEVLVEWEPTSYELKNVKFNQFKKGVIKRVPRVLGKATLINTGSEPANVDEAFAYSYNYSVYWGQGHAILKGLPTTIVLANGTQLPKIVWGTETDEPKYNVYTVGMYLEPQTAVNVTLTANYSDIEVTYTAQLVSHYQDGTKISRSVTGVRREVNMVDVRPEFGPVYYTGNFSLVPTTTTTTTTTTTPTSTTAGTSTAKTTRLNKNGANGDENDPDAVDVNLVVPRGEGNGGTTSVDGGPLSLTNKLANGDQSGALGLHPQALVLLLAGGILMIALRERAT